jgi:hypothetical protein
VDAPKARPEERPALRFGHQATLGISDRTLRKCRRYDPRARARAFMSENYRTIEGLADAGIAVAADRRSSPHNRDDGRLRRATGDNRADDLAQALDRVTRMELESRKTCPRVRRGSFTHSPAC